MLEESAVPGSFLVPEKIVAEESVDFGAGFARSMANTFDATSSPTLSPATLVSPQLQEDLLRSLTNSGPGELCRGGD